MKKVTILALHLGIGGIEKALISVANMLSSDYEVEIISTYQVLPSPAFLLNANVKVKYLIPGGKPNKKEFLDAIQKHKFIRASKEGIKAMHLLFLKKIRMIEAIKICDSDIIISTRYIYNLWLGKYGIMNCLKIGWEHNYHNNDQKFINKIVSSVQKLDKFVLVSEELRDFYSKRVPSSCQCVYIPNTLSYWPKKMSTLDNKKMISVGRLEKEKGFSDLIDIFKLFYEKDQSWMLDIIGGGFEQDNLQEKIKMYHLESNITIHGERDESYVRKHLQEASIYVLPSFTESFGIVILEAYSYGLPVVAFDTASGARTLVKNNQTGFLIADRNKVAMRDSMLQLANMKELRTKMGINGREYAKNYLEKKVKQKWITLIEEGR